MVQSIELGVILVSRNLAQFSEHGFFYLHTKKTDRPKVGIADFYLFKVGVTFILNHVVQRLEGAKIGVQAFVFLFFVHKKKLATSIIRVLLGIVHTLHDVILCKTRNRQGLYSTFVKKPLSLILTYYLPKLGLLQKSSSLPSF